MRKNSILCMLLFFVVLLSGCGDGKQPADVGEQPASVTESLVTETTEAEPEPEIPETSIAYKDWKIKESPVEGKDNLYAFSMDEYLGENSFLITLGAVGGHIAFITVGEDETVKLFLVDPLSMELLASTVLPEGVYYANPIKADNEGHIILQNGVDGQIYVFDEGLERILTIDTADMNTDSFVISDDLSYVYYYDRTTRQFFQYGTKDETRKELFGDIKIESDDSPFLISLMGEGKSLLFSYYNEAEENIVYEVRNIETGESKYKGVTGLSNVINRDGDYLFQQYGDNLFEVVYQKNGEEPKILSLEDYRENDCVTMNLQEKKVVTAECNSMADGLKSKIAWKCYRLDDGLCPYKVSLEWKTQEDAYYNAVGYYLDGTDCVFCQLSGEENRYFVWDLTKESSQSQDETCYLYKWQDPEHPDEEELERLRTLAEEIGNENGVEIYFGEDIKNCPTDVYSYKVTTNVIRIEKMLQLLKAALAKYPKGMLGQLDDEYGSVLHIYLSGGISPIDEVGLAGSIGIQNTIQDNTYLVLDINSFGDLENTIYHEIFHAVEIHLSQTDDGYFDDEEWCELNPSDFSYDYDYHENEENFSLDYCVDYAESDAYFIDTYSKSFPNEDRARIMEFAMLDDSRHEKVNYEHIQSKLQYISKKIRKGFDTTGWPAKTSWEQAILP